MQKPIIPFADYVRIYTAIYSVLESEKARTHRACKFFAFIGAAILEKHYKLRATPVAGAALYCVDEATQTNIFYGRVQDGYLACDDEAFHCWVQCEGYLIYFHAPLIRDVQAEEGLPVSVGRKMMQKPLSSQAENANLVTKTGDFLLMPNPPLTKHFLDEFAEVGLVNDLANICFDWYKKPPKNMAPRITTMGKNGEPIPIQFKAPRLDGIW